MKIKRLVAVALVASFSCGLVGGAEAAESKINDATFVKDTATRVCQNAGLELLEFSSKGEVTADLSKLKGIHFQCGGAQYKEITGDFSFDSITKDAAYISLKANGVEPNAAKYSLKVRGKIDVETQTIEIIEAVKTFEPCTLMKTGLLEALEGTAEAVY